MIDVFSWTAPQYLLQDPRLVSLGNPEGPLEWEVGKPPHGPCPDPIPTPTGIHDASHSDSSLLAASLAVPLSKAAHCFLQWGTLYPACP